MQSGISASKELVSHFNTLLESDNHLGLLVTIKGEALTPVELLTPPSDSASLDAFGKNVDSLVVPRLKAKEALYVLLRRHDTAPYFVAATYVPDEAPVRQKMLFASTRLALVRELGSEHFRETLFVTTADELSSQGFKRHDAHNALDAPLTEEERSLGEVKRAEQEAGRGTAARQSNLGSGLKVPISTEALAAIQELGNGKAFVSLKINPSTETVELAPGDASPSSISELARTISATEPRFTFYRYEHYFRGDTTHPLLFFYTCPTPQGTRPIKFRMMYPLMKQAVLDAATGNAGLTIDKRFTFEDPSEITEEVVLDELRPKDSVRKGFSRPKRPAR